MIKEKREMSWFREFAKSWRDPATFTGKPTSIPCPPRPRYTASQMKWDPEDDVVCQHAIWFNSCQPCLEKSAKELNNKMAILDAK